jgi:hypothetical protein
MKKIDYIYIYPPNWNGNSCNMNYQEVLRGDKYKMINSKNIPKISGNTNLYQYSNNY